MKTYKVTLQFLETVEVEVEAADEEAAVQLALKEDDVHSVDYEYWDCVQVEDVTEEED